MFLGSDIVFVSNPLGESQCNLQQLKKSIVSSRSILCLVGYKKLNRIIQQWFVTIFTFSWFLHYALSVLHDMYRMGPNVSVRFCDFVGNSIPNKKFPIDILYKFYYIYNIIKTHVDKIFKYSMKFYFCVNS